MVTWPPRRKAPDSGLEQVRDAPHPGPVASPPSLLRPPGPWSHTVARTQSLRRSGGWRDEEEAVILGPTSPHPGLAAVHGSLSTGCSSLSRRGADPEAWIGWHPWLEVAHWGGAQQGAANPKETWRVPPCALGNLQSTRASLILAW